jgi:hypothetical protein
MFEIITRDNVGLCNILKSLITYSSLRDTVISDFNILHKPTILDDTYIKKNSQHTNRS